MKTNIFLLFLLLISANIHSQTHISEIYVETEDCFGYTPRFNKNSDTTNIFLIFEAHFSGDSAKVHVNDTLVFDNTIRTGSMGYAKIIKLGKVNSVKMVSVKVENLPVIKLSLLFPEKHYIRLAYMRLHGIVGVCYSKYKPIYY